MSIAKLRAEAVARRKADGVPVNKFLGEAVEAKAEDYCLQEFKWFCQERENLRLTGETEDFILKHNKFTNIFRDDDKTTKFIFKHSSGTFEDLFYSRLINRVDYLDTYYKEGEGALEGKTFTNLGAYQLQPGIGWKYGFKTIKPAITSGAIRQDLPGVLTATQRSASIACAVEEGNKAFGGYIKFILFQTLLDQWTLNGDARIQTKPYLGEGSKPAIKAIGLSLEELQDHLQPLFNRKVHLFDAEHALCEYRKYVYQKARLAAGKKISKPYKPNSMGV